MAISAILQIGESGGGFWANVSKNLFSNYTVLNFDYTVERNCDKTGRPSGGSSISVINVTIRASKQKGAPFHEWIQSPDKLMDGVIKIYDSAGMLSSAVMENPALDVGEIVDIPNDVMGESMETAMDNASDYGHDQDIYDEMSHKDLADYARAHKITYNSGDSDDDIREKIRIQEETQNKIKKMDLDTVKEYVNKNEKLKMPDNSKEVKKMTLEELKDYVKKHKLKEPADTGNENSNLEAYQKLVTDDMDKNDGIALLLDNDGDVKQEIITAHDAAKVKKQAEDSAYKKADTLKSRTSSVVKSVVPEVARKVLECARSLTFENAYLISLKESFENNPDSKGELDSDYPWTLQLGIKPKTVKVTGEQLGPKVIGGEVKFDLY